MRIILFLVSLVISVNTFAFHPYLLSSTILDLMRTPTTVQTLPEPIIYGGQDISRVAVAHESLWTGQSTLIG